MAWDIKHNVLIHPRLCLRHHWFLCQSEHSHQHIEWWCQLARCLCMSSCWTHRLSPDWWCCYPTGSVYYSTSRSFIKYTYDQSVQEIYSLHPAEFNRVSYKLFSKLLVTPFVELDWFYEHKSRDFWVLFKIKLSGKSLKNHKLRQSLLSSVQWK